MQGAADGALQIIIPRQAGLFTKPWLTGRKNGNQADFFTR